MPPVSPRRFLTRLKWRVLRLTQLARGRQPVHFLHIGKTGGSAIKHVIHNNPVDQRLIVHLHLHSFRLRDVPGGDKVFFIVRDPLTRFVSAFYSRMRKGRPAYFYDWSEAEKAAFEEFKSPDELGLALSSGDPGRKGRAEDAMKRISHVRDSYWNWFENEDYFQSRIPDILFIGFQERLAEDFVTLKSKLGLPAGARLPDDDKLAHRSPGDEDPTLSPQAVTNLKEWYARDFEFVALCRQIRSTRQFP